jgi:hypothetical protein
MLRENCIDISVKVDRCVQSRPASTVYSVLYTTDHLHLNSKSSPTSSGGEREGPLVYEWRILDLDHIAALLNNGITQYSVRSIQDKIWSRSIKKSPTTLADRAQKVAPIELKIQGSFVELFRNILFIAKIFYLALLKSYQKVCRIYFCNFSLCTVTKKFKIQCF